LGLDSDQISERLSGDLKKYGRFTYFFGIIIALASSCLDQVSYFIIRSVGTQVPSSIFPFAVGLFVTIIMSVYCPLNYLLQESNEGKDSWDALGVALCGTTVGWLAVELIVIGLRMSKSALASYAEQCGVIVPFIFDAIALQRPFLKTDWVAVSLIVILEAAMAARSIRRKGDELKEVEHHD